MPRLFRTPRSAPSAVLFLGVLLFCSSIPVRAQQTCRSPVTNAQLSVSTFLINERYALWRQSLGITARRLEELRALDDATDAALCQRMDSTFAPTLAYYYWAGRYVLGTPVDDSMKELFGEGRTVFVFDSTGHEIPPQYGVFPPYSLHATAALSGRVDLAWTNMSADVASYRLQRATASGAFAPLGSAFSGSATTATDNTVLLGNSYRYRLVAYRGGADSVYSSDVTVAVTDIGSVSRQTTGLLFKDDFNRPSEQLVGTGKSWTRMGSPSVDADWQIQTNQAKGLSVGAGATQTEVYPNAITAQTGDIVVQAWWSRANTNGRSGVTLVQPAHAGGVMLVRDPIHGWEVWNWGAGFYTHPADQTGFTRESGVLKLRRKVGRYQAWVDGVTLFDIASDARLDTVALYPALIQLQQPATWDSYVGYKGNTVTITGLPAGYKLRVAGVTSPAAIAGQPTTLDVGGTSFPVAQIEVLDPANTVVKVYAPSDGVWGGDGYAFSSAP